MSLPIKEISSRLWAMEEKPQFEIPPFPWEELETIIAAHFKGKKISFRHQSKGWSEGEPWVSLFKGREIFPIYMPPVEHPLFWVMTKEDLESALSSICGQEEFSFYYVEKPIYEAFRQFFACEVLKLVSKLKFCEYLSFQISDDQNLMQKYVGKEPFFIIDVIVELDERSIVGTLVIPSSFRISWKKHFLQNYGPIFSPQMQKKLDLDLSIQIGYVDLLWNEFRDVRIGDWIMLDHCSYKPKENEGWAVLTIGGEPIFRARLDQNKLHVLEYSHLHQGEKEMEKNEEFENLEEEPFEEDEEEIVENNVEEEEPAEGSLLSKIPIHMIVEIAKLRMTLEELGKLQSGAVLELPVAYEEGVNLLINGKKIGKGELVKIGDKMGVRITEL